MSNYTKQDCYLKLALQEIHSFRVRCAGLYEVPIWETWPWHYKGLLGRRRTHWPWHKDMFTQGGFIFIIFFNGRRFHNCKLWADSDLERKIMNSLLSTCFTIFSLWRMRMISSIKPCWNPLLFPFYLVFNFCKDRYW